MVADEQREKIGEQRRAENAGKALQAGERALQAALLGGIDLVRDQRLRGRTGQAAETQQWNSTEKDPRGRRQSETQISKRAERKPDQDHLELAHERHQFAK